MLVKIVIGDDKILGSNYQVDAKKVALWITKLFKKLIGGNPKFEMILQEFCRGRGIWLNCGIEMGM